MFKTTSTIVDSFSFYNSYIFTPSFNNLGWGGDLKELFWNIYSVLALASQKT